MRRSSPCRRCGKRILFTKNTRGRWLLLDAEPVSLGEFVILEEYGADTPQGVRFDDLEPIEAVAFRERHNAHACTR